MIETLPPEKYLDEAYGSGVHVVLLHRTDDLYREARSQLKQAALRLQGSRGIKFWSCLVSTAEDAELIQVVKFPQFRFFRNGSESHSHVGVMDHTEIIDRVHSIGESSYATRCH